MLVATKLDRVARSMLHLMQIVDQVEAYGASLHILGLTLTPPAAGTLVLQILGEHERTMMLERQRVGIAKAKSEGKFKGRARTVMAKAGEVEVMLFVIDQFDDGDDAIQWCERSSSSRAWCRRNGTRPTWVVSAGSGSNRSRQLGKKITGRRWISFEEARLRDTTTGRGRRSKQAPLGPTVSRRAGAVNTPVCLFPLIGGLPGLT